MPIRNFEAVNKCKNNVTLRKATVVDVPLIDKSDLEAPEETEPALASNESKEEEDSSAPVMAKQITEEPEIDAEEKEKASAEADRIKEEAEEEKRQREKEEKYKAGYVGDGTWEEKTWKELVRLREDMFWARVGGFRD